jgi:hypothetical protein
VIALNSIFLGISDYSNVDSSGQLVTRGSWRNTLIQQTEIIFTSIFTVEMIVKWIAMGLSPTRGYFRDRWNILDFVVVVTGYGIVLHFKSHS